jgi:hypothetical protein
MESLIAGSEMRVRFADVAPARRFTTIFDYPLKLGFADHCPASHLRSPELALTQPCVNRVLAEAPK